MRAYWLQFDPPQMAPIAEQGELDEHFAFHVIVRAQGQRQVTRLTLKMCRLS
jgi:hypothetical protein